MPKSCSTNSISLGANDKFASVRKRAYLNGYCDGLEFIKCLTAVKQNIETTNPKPIEETKKKTAYGKKTAPAQEKLILQAPKRQKGLIKIKNPEAKEVSTDTSKERERWIDTTKLPEIILYDTPPFSPNNACSREENFIQASTSGYLGFGRSVENREGGGSILRKMLEEKNPAYNLTSMRLR
ncbi:MAG: hypothetical protein V4700_01535 [Pseudomonadota bacterium]